MSSPSLPNFIWIVRHGESAGNVARHEAEMHNRLSVKLPVRDVDVPLSPLGVRQAMALGAWFAQLSADATPSSIYASPFRRALETTALLTSAAGLELAPICVDERLREREFGIFDRLTRAGARRKYPEQTELREAVGKFYHRPPGGESWCDVILRLRSFLESMNQSNSGQRVLIVAHEVVVTCFRYLLDGMNENEVLALDRSTEVANCSVTTYELGETAGRSRMLLRVFNSVSHLEAAGETVTTGKDAPLPK